MKHFFILGRNPALSRQEIFAFLKTRRMNYNEILFIKNILILDGDFNIDIQELGGTIAFGNIEFDDNQNKFDDFLSSQELVNENKFNYSVVGNTDPEPLKAYFKRNKQKAVLKHGRDKLKFQDGGYDFLPKTKYSYFLYDLDGKILFGRFSSYFDYHDVEKRDMKKPVRREELAISPRLSKILINLSGATSKGLMGDPFCGVGGILQEALLKGIKVYGSDIDYKATLDGKKNLQWIKREFGANAKFHIEKRDVRDLPDKQFDAIATETPLGNIVRKKLDDRNAEKTIRSFERFIIPALQSMKMVKKNKAKIAITFPKIRRFGVDYENIVENTGLEIVMKPIEETKKGQFIGRDIVVFR